MAVGGALFGAAGPGSTDGNVHLIEIKAGKMYLKDRMVYPDERKGLLYMYQTEDELMHFCWKDRTSGDVEDDLIVFPDECDYVRVPQCTTGRVYLLRFRSSNKKLFFWLQEPKDHKDEENCNRINALLNGPPTSLPSLEALGRYLQSLSRD